MDLGSPVLFNGDEFENIDVAHLQDKRAFQRLTDRDHQLSGSGTCAEIGAACGEPHGILLDVSPLQDFPSKDQNRNNIPGLGQSARSCNIVITDSDVDTSSSDMLREMVKNKVCLMLPCCPLALIACLCVSPEDLCLRLCPSSYGCLYVHRLLLVRFGCCLIMSGEIV